MSSESAGMDGVEIARRSWLPSEDPLDQDLELVVWLARKKASSAALELQQMNSFRTKWQERYGLLDTDRDHVKWRSLRYELAAALTLPERTVERRIWLAKSLVEDFPTTLSRMKGGVVSERHAQLLVENLGRLPREQAAQLEAKLLPYAEKLVYRKFERKVRTTLEVRDPEGMDARHEEALKGREVWVEPAADGMAVLCNKMDAVEAHAAFNLAIAQAAALKVEGEERTHRQLVSDVMRDMLLDSDAQLSAAEPGEVLRDVKPRHRNIVPTVNVTVPALSLAGQRLAGMPLQPAMLDGYGPISIKQAAKFVGAASGFTRILTDPHTGIAVSVGREKYRPPAEMKAEVIRQDKTCRAVGCNRPADECDLDHTIPASALGDTALSNLGALCPNHHDQKHNGGWSLERGAARIMFWKSPLGRVYTTEPEFGDADEFYGLYADPNTSIHCMDEAWFETAADIDAAELTESDPDDPGF